MSPDRRKLTWWLSLVALIAANGLFVTFSVRQIKAEDLGYHVRYGMTFFETGRLVDSNQLDLYTLPDEGFVESNRPEPGPGCWYDENGQYRFANANWLSQVLFASAWSLGGEDGLSLLLFALTLGLSVTLSATMLRLGLPAGMAGCLLMLVAMASFPRLTLRPELVGYFVLAGQAWILAAVWRWDRLNLRGIAGLVVLQLVFVNVHSYFLLGYAMVGATLLGRLAMWQNDKVQAGVRTVKRLAIAMGLMLVGSLINPFGWRLTVLPIETMLFLRRHNLDAGPIGADGHPWSLMGDMKRTSIDWSLLMDADWVTLGFVLMLLVGITAAIEGIVKRRWDLVMVIGVFILLSFSAERNIAVGCMVIAVAGAAVGMKRDWPRTSAAHKRKLINVCSVGAIVGSVGLLFPITTQRLYVSEQRPIRFGWGLSRAYMPYGVVEWLNERGGLPGNTWTSSSTSSTIWGFTEPTPQLHMISNTWAYPPAIMREIFQANGSYGETDFEPTAQTYNVETIIAEPGALLKQLMRSGHWQPVYVEGRYVLLVRKDSATAERWQVDETTQPQIVSDVNDPAWEISLLDHLELLMQLGQLDQAIDTLERQREKHGPIQYPSGLPRQRFFAMLSRMHALRGLRDWPSKPDEALEDFYRARGALMVGSIRSDRAFFRQELVHFRNMLQNLAKHTPEPQQDELQSIIQSCDEFLKVNPN